MSTPAPNPQSKHLSKGEIAMLVVVVLIFGLVGWQSITATPKTATPPKPVELERHSDHEAYGDAKEIIKKLLKSPSTAEFPSLSEARITPLQDDGFRIVSYVDSQNGFGAMLRTEWDIVFIYEDESIDIYGITLDGELVYKKEGI